MCEFFVNLDNFFAVVCMGFHKVVVCTRYFPFVESNFKAANDFLRKGNALSQGLLNKNAQKKIC